MDFFTGRRGKEVRMSGLADEGTALFQVLHGKEEQKVTQQGMATGLSGVAAPFECSPTYVNDSV